MEPQPARADEECAEPHQVRLRTASRPLPSCRPRVSNSQSESQEETPMNRRQFLKDASTTMGAVMFAPSLLHGFEAAPSVSHVAFVKTTDRASGVKRAIELLGMEKFRGKDLFIKPNFNSADPTPGSTHEETLAALLRQLKAMGAGPLTLGDRSGMGDTRAVMGKKSAFQIGKELDAKVIVFDELGADDWELIKFQRSEEHTSELQSRLQCL